MQLLRTQSVCWVWSKTEVYDEATSTPVPAELYGNAAGGAYVATGTNEAEQSSGYATTVMESF